MEYLDDDDGAGAAQVHSPIHTRFAGLKGPEDPTPSKTNHMIVLGFTGRNRPAGNGVSIESVGLRQGLTRRPKRSHGSTKPRGSHLLRVFPGSSDEAQSVRRYPHAGSFTFTGLRVLSICHNPDLDTYLDSRLLSVDTFPSVCWWSSTCF